jgi:calcium-dependent protein kinase
MGNCNSTNSSKQRQNYISCTKNNINTHTTTLTLSTTTSTLLAQNEYSKRNIKDNYPNSTSDNFILPSTLNINHTNITTKYDLTKVIGEGTSGKVYLGKNKKTKQKCAIKQINKETIISQSAIIKEVKFNIELSHANIIKCYEIYEDEEYINFVLELGNGGDLFDFIMNSPKSKIPINLCIELTEQILSVIDYLHNDKGIMHRDLKPENFMIIKDKKQTPIVKLIDFGSAEIIPGMNDICLNELVGTPSYCAPEMVSRDFYMEKVDIWSCGVILFNMLTGCELFSGETNEEIYNEVQNKEIPFNVIENENMRNLIMKMLDRNPHSRINAKEALSYISEIKGIKRVIITKDSFDCLSKKKPQDDMNMYFNSKNLTKNIIMI